MTAGQPFASETRPDAERALRSTSTSAASLLSIASAVWFSSRTSPYMSSFVETHDGRTRLAIRNWIGEAATSAATKSSALGSCATSW